MNTLEIIASALLMLSAVVITIVVAMQSSKGDGLTSAIMGSGSLSSARERGKTTDAKLATVTKWLAAIFFVVSLAVNVILLIKK